MRWWVRSALLVLAAAFVLSPGVAAADPPPPGAPPPPTTSTTPLPGQPPAATPGSGGRGVMGALLGDESIDYGRYDFGYDEGAWNSFSRKFWGFLTQLVWSCVTWLVGIGSWLLSWSLQFGFAKLLADPAARVAAVWQTQIVTRLGLPAFLLLCAAAWSGVQLLRGRRHRGLAELGLSLVIAVLGAVVLADPAHTLLGDNGLLGKTRDLSLEIAAITLVDDPTHAPGPGADPSTVIKPMTAALAHGLIVEPHMLLDWGQSLDNPDQPRPACLAAYQQLITDGPHGTDDGPRNRMTAAGCPDLAQFNHDPGPDRLLGAAMVFLAAFLIIVLLVVIALGLAGAQIALAALACVAVFAIPLGVLPVAGRMALISCATGVLKALAAVIATIGFLAVFLVVLVATINTGGGSLLGRLALLDVLVVFSFVARRRITNAFARAISAAGHSLSYATRALGADSFTRALQRGGGYGSHGMRGFGAGAAGGITAATLTELWRENTAEIRQVTRPVTTTARRAASSRLGRMATAAATTAGKASTRAAGDTARAATAAGGAAATVTGHAVAAYGTVYGGEAINRLVHAARASSLATAFGLATNVGPAPSTPPGRITRPAAAAPQRPGPQPPAVPGSARPRTSTPTNSPPNKRPPRAAATPTTVEVDARPRRPRRPAPTPRPPQPPPPARRRRTPD